MIGTDAATDNALRSGPCLCEVLKRGDPDWADDWCGVDPETVVRLDDGNPDTRECTDDVS